MTQKNPAARREKMLLAAAELIVKHGADALTLDAVAANAGISKGGLLHHFPTKDALIHGMLDHLTQRFLDKQAQLLARETPGTPGRWLRAYIDMTFTDDEAPDVFDQALAHLVVIDPDLRPMLQEKFRYLGECARDDGLPPGQAELIRIACDGYWLGNILGMSDLDAAQRAQLRDTLHALTHQLLSTRASAQPA